MSSAFAVAVFGATSAVAFVFLLYFRFWFEVVLVKKSGVKVTQPQGSVLSMLVDIVGRNAVWVSAVRPTMRFTTLSRSST